MFLFYGNGDRISSVTSLGMRYIKSMKPIIGGYDLGISLKSTHKITQTFQINPGMKLEAEILEIAYWII